MAVQKFGLEIICKIGIVKSRAKHNNAGLKGSVGNHTRMDRPAWTNRADPCGGLRHDDRIKIAD